MCIINVLILLMKLILLLCVLMCINGNVWNIINVICVMKIM